MLAGIKAGGENKNANNRFQGTLHKVSGPLNRDVGHLRIFIMLKYNKRYTMISVAFAAIITTCFINSYFKYADEQFVKAAFTNEAINRSELHNTEPDTLISLKYLNNNIRNAEVLFTFSRHAESNHYRQVWTFRKPLWNTWKISWDNELQQQGNDI